MSHDIDERLHEFARWWNENQPPPPDPRHAFPAPGVEVSRRTRRGRRIGVAVATLGALAVVALAVVVSDHAGDDGSGPPALPVTTSAAVSTSASATRTPSPTVSLDPIDARLLAFADRQAAADHGTATHVDAVLTTLGAAQSILSPGSSGPDGATRVWLLDISGPTRFVCDTCHYVTAAPTGTHVQLLVDAATYAPAGQALDDREPDLAQAGPVRTLR